MGGWADWWRLMRWQLRRLWRGPDDAHAWTKAPPDDFV